MSCSLVFLSWCFACLVYRRGGVELDSLTPSNILILGDAYLLLGNAASPSALGSVMLQTEFEPLSWKWKTAYLTYSRSLSCFGDVNVSRFPAAYALVFSDSELLMIFFTWYKMSDRKMLTCLSWVSGVFWASPVCLCMKDSWNILKRW